MKIFKKIFYVCLFIFMFSLVALVGIKPKAMNEDQVDYNTLSTTELTEIILDNSDMLVFNTSNTYKIGFDNLYYYSEVYRILCTREDFHTILLNNYLNIRHQDVFVEEISKRIYRLEILLSNEEILNKFSEEEIEILYQELEVKKEDRLELDVIYHYDTNVFYESVEEQGLISTYSSDTAITGYTPHGKPINLVYIISARYSPQALEEERARISALSSNIVELYPPMSGFDCSRYAFYSQSIDNPYTLQGDSNLLQYVDDSLYKKISDDELDEYVPKPGDIIGYIDQENAPGQEMLGMDHFAVVESNTNGTLAEDNRNSIIVTSKWSGSGGIYRHRLEDYEGYVESDKPFACFKLLTDKDVTLSNTNHSFVDEKVI